MPSIYDLPTSLGLSLSDIVPAVIDPDGSPTTNRVTISQLLSLAWPIGSIFTSTVNTNPSTLLGFGTWIAFGSGRVLVGLDVGQTEFDTLEETGGAKNVTLTGAQSGVAVHSHGVTDPGHSHAQMRFPTTTGGSTGFTADTSMSGTPSTVNNTASITTGLTINDANAIDAADAHTNLQPYITVNFWKRTA